MPPWRALLALVAACAWATAWAAGEHERRLAAELVVMAGDTRRLASTEGGPREREGLRKRLEGALSSLPLLLRRAQADPGPVAALRAALARDDLNALTSALATLKRRHPFDARRLLPAPATREMPALGAELHRTTCAGCHDRPGQDSLLPAKNLANQIKTMPPEEFAARLLLGVRGDHATSFNNPFNDLELAALIAWYRGP